VTISVTNGRVRFLRLILPKEHPCECLASNCGYIRRTLQFGRWDGPWDFGMSKAVEKPFKPEAECRNSAIQMIGELHQGMLAPMRFQCVPFASNLPKGASR
jgi:hypothetical protein